MAESPPPVPPPLTEEEILRRVSAMANVLAGGATALWYDFEPNNRRPMSLISRHGEATLEGRALQTVQWLFSLFNIPATANRIIEKGISMEMSELVANHLVVWKDLEATPLASSTEAIAVTARRQVAYSHEVIYKAFLLWERLQDLLYLQALPNGNWYDASVPSQMCLSYDRAYEMRKMLADPPLLAESDGEDRKKRDMEVLVSHLLEQARANKFRKRGNIVYQEKHVCWMGARYGTCAWVPAHFGSSRSEDEHSLESFVLYFCRRDLYPEMHGALVRCLPARKLAEFLALCDESDFPFVKPVRHLLSFRNGVYDTLGAGLGEFHPYGVPSTARISHLAAAKFFDVPMPDQIFDEEWGRPAKPKSSRQTGSDGTDVPVPVGEWSATALRRELDCLDCELTRLLYQLERASDQETETTMENVMKYWGDKVHNIKERTTQCLHQYMHDQGLSTSKDMQVDVHCVDGSLYSDEPKQESYGATSRASAFPLDAQKWVYIFMGRMLHKLKEQEDWQIIPFLKGRGGSGKSTVATVIKNFFEAADVGILSNNSERKFGLQALLDKFIWLCLELKRNIALDQAEFQSMVSGEDMMIAQKNQVARQINWSAPGLLCGNEAPSWVDAQGSIARRMAIISFTYSLQERDVVPDLLKKILQRELPALIVKCNQAYRITCETSRQHDIWKILPPYFKNERLNFQKDTDAVYAAVFDAQRFDLWSKRQKPSEPFESYYVQVSLIEDAYRNKWRELMGSMFAEPFTPEKYANAFQSAGIDGPIHCKRVCPVLGNPVEDMWCIGIRKKQ